MADVDELTIKGLVIELIDRLGESLRDPDLHPALRASYAGMSKELNALVDAYYMVALDHVSAETMAVNEVIAADWADASKDVDPNVPHVFDEPVDADPDVVEEV